MERDKVDSNLDFSLAIWISVSIGHLSHHFYAYYQHLHLYDRDDYDDGTPKDFHKIPVHCELDVDDVSSNGRGTSVDNGTPAVSKTPDKPSTSQTCVQSTVGQTPTPSFTIMKKRRRNEDYGSAVQLIANTLQGNDDETDLFAKCLGAEIKTIKCEKKKKKEVKLELMKVLYTLLDE